MRASGPWQSPQASNLAVLSQSRVTLSGCLPGLKPTWQLMQASLP